MDINNIKEKIFSFTERFASRTGDYALITKLTMEIKTFETKISSLYAKLGEKVYNSTGKNADAVTIDEGIKELLDRIAEYKVKIKDTHNTIADIRRKAEEETEKKKTDKDTDAKEDDSASKNGDSDK